MALTEHIAPSHAVTARADRRSPLGLHDPAGSARTRAIRANTTGVDDDPAACGGRAPPRRRRRRRPGRRRRCRRVPRKDVSTAVRDRLLVEQDAAAEHQRRRRPGRRAPPPRCGPGPALRRRRSPAAARRRRPRRPGVRTARAGPAACRTRRSARPAPGGAPTVARRCRRSRVGQHERGQRGGPDRDRRESATDGAHDVMADPEAGALVAEQPARSRPTTASTAPVAHPDRGRAGAGDQRVPVELTRAGTEHGEEIGLDDVRGVHASRRQAGTDLAVLGISAAAGATAHLPSPPDARSTEADGTSAAVIACRTATSRASATLPGARRDRVRRSRPLPSPRHRPLGSTNHRAGRRPSGVDGDEKPRGQKMMSPDLRRVRSSVRASSRMSSASLSERRSFT